MYEQRFQRKINRNFIITNEQKNKKCHNERNEIEIFWTKKKKTFRFDVQTRMFSSNISNCNENKCVNFEKNCDIEQINK